MAGYGWFSEISWSSEAATRGVLWKKLFLKLSQKDTPTQVFSSEYCETFENTYFEEHLRTAASGYTCFTINYIDDTFLLKEITSED